MASAERVLTQPELNRALLARQLLLERASGGIPRTLERMGTLQAQYAPSMYIGLWSRLEGFQRDALTSALERRAVVQGTLMRATIHLVSAADYWPLALAIRKARRESWLAYRKGEPSAAKMSAAAKRLRSALRKGPMARKQVDALLEGGSVVTNGVNMWADLLRIPPSGTWERRRADLYAAAEQWLGPPPKISQAKAAEHLVRRYLTGFAPATRNEIADWGGLPMKQVEQAQKGLKLRSFRSEDGKELLDLPRGPLPDPDTPAPVRFLPTWDATLLVHARRTGILPEDHRSKVFNVKTPQSVPTFTVDGLVAGTWKYDGRRVKPIPFAKLDASAQRELATEAERLTEFHSEREP